ncbi:sensor histidine kinase [Leptospira langatensis]|uniref:histidine kinase n=1 Tax=Leptospira langatensis TaxID=2484983 RepID=A0A5F1ZYC1_9LEPT|nr:sensor histidine kinase [Leptospira langatensis]TGK00161.1 sensor histidine kinase [Leptospira langatensis]TGL42796.1 sensor histidine kinase [Leptospira langatensis]
MFDKLDRLYINSDYLTRIRAKHLFFLNAFLLVSCAIVIVFSVPKFRPGFTLVSFSSALSLILVYNRRYNWAVNITLSSCLLALTIGLVIGIKTDARSYAVAILILLFLYFTDIRKTIFVSLYCLLLLVIEAYWNYMQGEFQSLLFIDRIMLHCMFSCIAILIVRLLYGHAEEKDNLIKEIHHRVRNNMQVLSGLVEMHSIENGDTSKILQEFQRRMLSISEVQNAIYKEQNYNEIVFSEVGAELIARICEKHRIPNLKIQNDMQLIRLNTEKAIPLALIFSELVSNAVIHGSREKNSPEIFVSFERINRTYRLKIQDFGSGFEDWKIWNTPKTIGFTLVQILCKQLRGRFQIQNEKGTQAIVEFDA